jgi:hypothetical protein
MADDPKIVAFPGAPDPRTIEPPDVETRSTRNLLSAIEAYGFKAGGRHPLKHCV